MKYIYKIPSSLSVLLECCLAITVVEVVEVLQLGALAAAVVPPVVLAVPRALVQGVLLVRLLLNTPGDSQQLTSLIILPSTDDRDVLNVSSYAFHVLIINSF